MAVDDIESLSTEQSPLLANNEGKARSTSSSTSSTSGTLMEATESDEQLLSEISHSHKVAVMICLLLIGTFIANADGTIVIATYGTISSQFKALQYGNWIATSYMLATCAAQPVIGKLTDIYGRKPVLLACYAFFIVGVILCGLGQTMWQVCIGRGISGVGGAGMGVIVSILITELVAARDVAVWRSYVNVVATTGRSIGGPLGGWLADTVGWRWSFIGQGPIMMGAFVLVAYGLKSHEPVVGPKGATPSKLGRIDFLGALLITSTIITFILAADLPSQDFSWTSPPVISLFMVAITLGAAFFYYEAKYALEPIFHPSLLVQRNVYTSYLGLSLATAAQVSMMYSVPLYFQITQRATNTQAGARLVPAVLGNTIGALSAGFYIKNTGRYKNLTIFAALSCATSYLVMILTWHGESSFLESLAIVPGGFGNGIAMASTFIALTANLPRKDIAVGTSGLYLMGSIGVVLGVSLSSSIQTSTLKRALEEQLPGLDGRKIIESVLSDVDYVKNLTGSLRDIVVGSYVLSLEYAHGFSLTCSLIAFVVALFVPDHRLEK